MPKIILDPGHDPVFPGARAIFDEVTKARQIVALAEKQLKECGFNVLVVPDGLGGTSGNSNLIKKIEWINRHSTKQDILISVHCNAGGGEGTEVFYYDGDTFSRGVAEVYSNLLSEITNSPNRGAKPDTRAVAKRLGIIRDTKPIPAILSENGFVDSHADAAKGPELYAEALHQIIHRITHTECKKKIEPVDNFEQKYYALKEQVKKLLDNY